jgi:BlaI family transcriptional regulator, penicillinase repressor
MKASVPISEAESVVMNVLWQKSPIATEEIVTALSRREWKASTIKTLLNRLLKKGAIKAQRDGRRFLYSPVMKRERWLLDESNSLLDRVFGGRVAPLVAHFSRTRKLSKRDVEELKLLIRELDDGH